MKAIVWPRYGSPDVLRLEDVPTPTPGDSQVLIEVHAASVNAGDWHLLRADPFLVRLFAGLRKPKFPIPGADLAGRVHTVGSGVTRFQPGDLVYGDISGDGFGAFAEFACAREDLLAPLPEGIDPEVAAAVPEAGVTALQGLRDHGRIQAGQRVLIHGASGGVGTFAVQIAKAMGAHVTGVCSTRSVDLVASIGADRVLDYTREDFAREDHRYDLILATGGDRSPLDYRRALTPTGRFVLAGGSMRQLMRTVILAPWLNLIGKRHLGNYLAKPNQADLVVLSGLLEAGSVVPVIDRREPLEKVPEAIRYVEEGHPMGKVVIKVSDSTGMP